MDFLFTEKIYLPILYICIGIIVNGIITRIINRTLNLKQTHLRKESYNYKKTETIKSLLVNIVKYLVAIFVILAILPVYGVDITTLLAGLGIIGVVVGLAFQDIAKDLLSGLTIVFENQFAVGDIVEIGNFKGTVIFLGLKTTKIKSLDGKIKVLANRNITEVINYSMEYNLVTVDISVSYEENNDHVEKVIEKILEKADQNIKNIIGSPKLQGIVELDSSAVIYRITAEANAKNVIQVERDIRKLLKIGLDKEKIKIPYTQIEVHNGK